MRDYAELNSKITGDISIEKSNYGGEEVTTVKWQGGDVVAITGGVIEDIVQNKVEDLYTKKHGSFVTIGDYTVKIFDYYQEFDIYLAKRVN